jgi:hypothetical protein
MNLTTEDKALIRAALTAIAMGLGGTDHAKTLAPKAEELLSRISKG